MTETTKIIKMTDICTKKLELKHLESERIELFPLPKGDTTNSDIGAWYVIVSKEGSLPIGRIGIVHCHPEWRHTLPALFLILNHNLKAGVSDRKSVV